MDDELIIYDDDFLEKWRPRLPESLRDDILRDFRQVIAQMKSDHYYEIIEMGERS